MAYRRVAEDALNQAMACLQEGQIGASMKLYAFALSVDPLRVSEVPYRWLKRKLFRNQGH